MFDNSTTSVLHCFDLPPNHIIRLNCHRTFLFFCPPICCQINPLVGGSYRSTRRERSGFSRHQISGCSLTALRLQRFVGSSPNIKLRYGRAQSLPPADAKPMAARRIAGAPPPLVQSAALSLTPKPESWRRTSGAACVCTSSKELFRRNLATSVLGKLSRASSSTKFISH